MYFHYNDKCLLSSIRTPALGVMKFYNFGRPFLGHHCNIFKLSYSWSYVDKNRRVVWPMSGSWEKRIFKRKNVFSLHYLDGHALAQQFLFWGSWNYNFGSQVLSYYYYLISSSEPCPEVKENIFMKYINFTHFTLTLTSLWFGDMQFAIYCLLTLQILHIKFG